LALPLNEGTLAARSPGPGGARTPSTPSTNTAQKQTTQKQGQTQKQKPKPPTEKEKLTASQNSEDAKLIAMQKANADKTTKANKNQQARLDGIQDKEIKFWNGKLTGAEMDKMRAGDNAEDKKLQAAQKAKGDKQAKADAAQRARLDRLQAQEQQFWSGVKRHIAELEQRSFDALEEREFYDSYFDELD
jgi:hypothetical protein